MKTHRDLQIIDLMNGRHFVHLRINAPKRLCVTTFAGRVGTAGKRTVRTFEDREAMEEFVEQKVDAKIDNGFVQLN